MFGFAKQRKKKMLIIEASSENLKLPQILYNIFLSSIYHLPPFLPPNNKIIWKVIVHLKYRMEEEWPRKISICNNCTVSQWKNHGSNLLLPDSKFTLGNTAYVNTCTYTHRITLLEEQNSKESKRRQFYKLILFLQIVKLWKCIVFLNFSSNILFFSDLCSM